jgi:hypothetical protein
MFEIYPAYSLVKEYAHYNLYLFGTGLESVLKKRSHEVKKHKLKISDKPEPPSKGEEVA